MPTYAVRVALLAPLRRGSRACARLAARAFSFLRGACRRWARRRMYRARSETFGGRRRPPVACDRPWALLVQKFGGTSVADPDRIRAVADHVVRTRRAGDDVVVVVSAMGKTTDDLRAARPRRLRSTRRPGARHAAHRGRADLDGAALHGGRGPRACPRCRFTGSQAGIVTDTAHGRAKIIEVKGDRIREALAAGSGRDRRRASRASRPTATSPRSAAGGSDTHRGRARGGARRRGVRDLHRRRGRLHRRPARSCPRRASSPASRSTRCSRWPRPAARCSRCARSSSRATTTCPIHVRSSFTWAPGTWVTEEDRSLTHGAGDHLGCHARHRRRPRSRSSRCPTGPASRRTLFRALADAGGQRRHDRAERLDRRPHRHLVHRPARRPPPRARA